MNWITHFYSDFPNSALGSCFAMQTSSLAGQWVNVLCGGTSGTATKLPYVCSIPGNSHTIFVHVRAYIRPSLSVQISHLAYEFPDEIESSECPEANVTYTDGDTVGARFIRS